MCVLSDSIYDPPPHTHTHMNCNYALCTEPHMQVKWRKVLPTASARRSFLRCRLRRKAAACAAVVAVAVAAVVGSPRSSRT